MRKERKHYTAEEKVAILRRHLLDKVPVSDLSEELGLQPTVFYGWQKEFFENGAAAFQSTERPCRQAEEKQKHQYSLRVFRRQPACLAFLNKHDVTSDHLRVKHAVARMRSRGLPQLMADNPNAPMRKNIGPNRQQTGLPHLATIDYDVVVVG